MLFATAKYLRVFGVDNRLRILSLWTFTFGSRLIRLSMCVKEQI